MIIKTNQNQVDASLKDTTVVEWYKDGTKIDLFGSGNPTVNCEYCDSTEEDSDYSTQDPRIILHPNNSITIQDVTSDDVGVYLCRVNTGLTEKLSTYISSLFILKYQNLKYYIILFPFIRSLLSYLFYSCRSGYFIHGRLMVVDCDSSFDYFLSFTTICIFSD